MALRLPAALAGTTALVACATALVCAPAALADTTTSSNWAGYASHGPGVSYRNVQGSWRQPSVTCRRGVQAYSSYWVGLGGYSQTSKALEQIGTDVDCTSSGRVRSTAWYELVPSPSVPIQLTVQPRDLINASVTVDGGRVSLSLYDVTRKHGFTKTVVASTIDVSSAEWILEAPAECISANACQTLPLANFGTAEFDSAVATSTSGHVGGISDAAWQATKIKLVPAGHRFVDSGSATVGAATPSALATNLGSFTVSYSQVTVTNPSQFFARDSSALRAGYLLHPGR